MHKYIININKDKYLYSKNIKISISRIYIIITLLLVIIGGTYAWFSYSSKQSALVLTIGNLTDTQVKITSYHVNENMIPVNVYTDGVYSQIHAINNTNKTVEVLFYYNINGITSDLINNGLKYTIVSSNSENGVYTVVETSDFTGYSNDKFEVFNVSLSSNTTMYYRIYLWLDSSIGEHSSIQNTVLNLELNVEFKSNNSIVPILDDGMIPVLIDDNGKVFTVTEDSEDWYDYEKKRWANVVLVKETGIQTRSYYKNNLANNVEVEQSDILAYYVWIPRYKYQIWQTNASSNTSPQTINIEFESANEDVTTGEYITHPAFIFNSETISGIWVGKFEFSHTSLASSTTSNNLGCIDENCVNADGLIIKNNVVSLKRNSVSKFFYASRSMIRFNNPFGLNSTQTDSHMMKNSEWGAVAYLSHSKYGINSEIRLNNNSGYKTGCGATDENGTSTSSCTLAYGSGISSYPQSTTGNITGIFDVSGGTYEYVMGNYKNTIGSSAFSSMPDLRYYNLYSTNSISSCTLQTCGGHALYETSGWYSDSRNFVSASYPWLIRGGNYGGGSSAGVWWVGLDNGGANSYTTFRSTLICKN